MGPGLGLKRGDLGRGVEVLPIDSLERTLQTDRQTDKLKEYVYI